MEVLFSFGRTVIVYLRKRVLVTTTAATAARTRIAVATLDTASTFTAGTAVHFTATLAAELAPTALLNPEISSLGSVRTTQRGSCLGFGETGIHVRRKTAEQLLKKLVMSTERQFFEEKFHRLQMTHQKLTNL
jgi:hypothetical protein